MGSLINILITLNAVIYIADSHINQVEGKKYETIVKCQLDQCQLKQQHFALYSFVKTYLDNDFDLSGREIIPFLKSVDVLKRRFNNQGEQSSNLNGTSVVRELLSNEKLVSALSVFNSDEGKALINFYRASVNGRSQNLACSRSRVEDFEAATNKFDTNKLLASVFANIHKNYLKKSAKKCLKHSCTSIETSMIKLDSVLGSKYQSSIIEDQNSIGNDVSEVSSQDNYGTFLTQKREFESEESELCKFFRKTNVSDCEISGRELSEISFITTNSRDEANKTEFNSLKDYLKSYYNNNKLEKSTLVGNSSDSEQRQQQKDLDEAAKSILAQCRPISSLLDYNLAAIKWYRKQNLIDEQKLNSRTFWCPSLSYWLQIDRLCGEVESSLENPNASETFSYEVGLNKND